MSRVVDYLFKGHDGVTPMIRKMNREQKRFEATSKRSISTWRKAGAQTAGWLKRELNLRNAINTSAAKFLGAAGIAGFATMAIKEHAKLEDAMFKVKQRTGETTKDVAVYRDMIQDLAIQTGQSAPLIADAMAEFAGAGDDIATSYEKAKVAAMGATIAQTDVATIAAGMQPIMTAWNIEAERSTEIMAKMIVAADSGTVELEHLSGVMSDLTGPADRANASVEVVLAGIETLGKTLKVAEAGTAFARMMESFADLDVQKNFTKETKKMGEAMSFTDAQGNMKSFNVNLKQLHTAWSSLKSDTERTKFIKSLGLDDVRVIRALDPILKNFKEYERILGNIDDATPADVLRLLESQSDRTSVKLAKLNQQFRVLGADTGEMLEPLLTSLVEKISRLNEISKTGETPKGKGALGRLERFAFTQEALGGGKLGAVGATGVAGIDALLSLVSERRLGLLVRKKAGKLTGSEERAFAAQKKRLGGAAAPVKPRGMELAFVQAFEGRLGKGAKDIQSTGQVQATGQINSQGPVRSSGVTTITGPVSFTGPVNLKASPAQVDGK